MEENNENNIVQNNDEVIKNVSKGSYITGTIGAILGAAIASLPWILVYVYGNMIVAILAIFIALGAFQGYKIFKGKVGKPLPAIIAIVSLLTIVVVTMLVCPLIALANEGLDVSFAMIEKLYDNSEFVGAITHDLLISLAFTIIGIAGTIKSINMQIKSGSQDIKFSEQPLLVEFQKELKKNAEVVKKAFETLNAVKKEDAVTKNEVMNELDMTYNVKKNDAKKYFQLLYNNEVIQKVKGKYYYDVENEESKLNNSAPYKENKKTAKIAIIIVLVVCAAIIIAAITTSSSETKITIPNTSTEITVTSDLIIYDTAEEISETFGEDYSKYYNIAILDEDKEIEMFGIVVNKANFEEEYTLQQIAESDRMFAEQSYNDVSEIKDKTIGETNFKFYTYSYGTETTYLGNIWIADLGDEYLFLDCYADFGNQARIDEVLNTLFK